MKKVDKELTAIVFGIIIASIRILIFLYEVFYSAEANDLFVNIYKDIAHIYIGGLFVSYMYEKRRYLFFDFNWQLKLFVLMSAIEVFVSTLSRLT